MLRYRRQAAQHKNVIIDEWDDLANLREIFKTNQQQKDLKTEIQHLRLENKLNQQIRHFIDKRLNQLVEQEKSEE